ncbi:hypothetical protein Salat_2469600 [Sesamum alatum]|uniref:Uncharacterized protein n=1 Tax=Sesamum alatum TaxID=300844 RepID=A0AAE1XR45_9LAMI|nr:hypothetical protein Salat_2469600 [Sesamum alatum]
MEATSLLPATPRLPLSRFSGKHPSYKNRRKGLIILAQQGDHQSDGKSVDDNMIVLKMRIKKMKVSDSIRSSNQGSADAAAAKPPSSDWKEWEKKLFTRYHEGVCDSVELLQSFLMNTRPSVAVGMLVLVAMSVPVSSSVVVVNALKVARALLAGCHVCIDIDF